MFFLSCDELTVTLEDDANQLLLPILGDIDPSGIQLFADEEDMEMKLRKGIDGGNYEKQRDAPAATLVQHNKSPSAAASAPGDANSAATLSAAQLANQCSSSCNRPTQTRNSRSKTSEVQIEDSSKNPELKKFNRCNYSYKRQCGSLGLLDECTKTTCSFVS